MKVSGFLGRRQFVAGRIFEPTAPRGFRRTAPYAGTRLTLFSLGRWGWVVITWSRNLRLEVVK